MLNLIGIENEFELFRKVDGAYKKLEAKDFVQKLVKLSDKRCFKKSDWAYRLWTGGAFYVDGQEPEIATPPVEVGKNCVKDVTNLLTENRNALVELVENYNNKYSEHLKLKAYSMHCNFSSNEPVYMAKTVINNAALPLLLLIEQKYSKGIRIIPKLGRLEFGGDCVMNQYQVQAAMAYMLGMLDAVKNGAKLDIKCKNKYIRDEFGSSFFIDYPLKKSRNTNIEIKRSKSTLTLQEILEHYFKRFREHIAKYAEIELVEEFVYGKRKLEIDLKKLPKRYVNVKKLKMKPFTKPKLARAFARASNGAEIVSGLKLKTKEMYWEYILFELVYLNKRKISTYISDNEIRVDIDSLVKFYNELDTKNYGELFKNAQNKNKIFDQLYYAVWGVIDDL